MVAFSLAKTWRRALRCVAALVLVVMAAALPIEVAASFAELCVDDCADCGDDAGESQDDDHDCNCPLGCNACCSQTGARAAPSLVELTLLPATSYSLLHELSRLDRAPDGVRFEVLHVPKRAS